MKKQYKVSELIKYMCYKKGKKMNEKQMAKFWTLIEKIIRFFLIKIFRLKLSNEDIENVMQFIKFGIVGLSNTVISYVIYLVSLLTFEKTDIFHNTDYLVSQVIAFVLSVLWSFYWNRKFVFKADEQVSWLKALIKTYISYAFTGLFLNSILSILWVDILNMSKLIAPIINLIVSVPLNFILNKFWAFKKK